MEAADRRQEEEKHRHQQHLQEQSGRGDDSPVFFSRDEPTATTTTQDDHDGAATSPAAPVDTEGDGPSGDQEDGDSDFEFAFASGGVGPPAIRSADEIFSDGHIRPVYPVFDRGLFLYYQSLAAKEEEERQDAAAAVRLPLRDLMRQPGVASTSQGGATTRRGSMDAGSSSAQLTRVGSCSSSDADDLEGVPAETYCLWTPGSVPPSPDTLGGKSRSTGSTGSRRWRLRDLVLGRSHSDGRRKLMFFQHEEMGEQAVKSTAATAAAVGTKSAEEKKEKKSSSKDEGKKQKGGNNNGKDQQKSTAAATNHRKKKSIATELDLATAHRLYYNNNNLKSGAAGAASGEGQRRPSTSLPYRKDLFVGIFPHGRSPGRGSGLGLFNHGQPSFYGF